MFAERRIFSVKPGGTYSKQQALKGGPCQSKRGYVGKDTHFRPLSHVGVEDP